MECLGYQVSFSRCQSCRVFLSMAIVIYCQKKNDKLSFLVSSTVKYLDLIRNNLSDECLPILLRLFANVTYLYLSGNNFKILPECLKECRFLWSLQLNECKSLQEIRGIPPTLKNMSALRCGSLNSSSRSMLVNQQLHEGGETKFCFPSSRTETIPKWFEHQSKQPTISFWYRNNFPSIALFFSTKWMHNKDSNSIDTKFRGNLFINGHTCTFVGNGNPFDPSIKKKRITLIQG